MGRCRNLSVRVGALSRESLGISELAREPNDLLRREPVVEFGHRGGHWIYTPKCVYNLSGQLWARRTATGTFCAASLERAGSTGGALRQGSVRANL